MQVQYVTDEQGQRTAVLLDVNEYRRLVGEKSIDPELFMSMSQSELEALANSRLAPDAQARLEMLLNEQKQNQLNEAQTEEMDRLLAQIDQLTILKTRARYTLAQPQPG
jgi:aminopeptidase C